MASPATRGLRGDPGAQPQLLSCGLPVPRGCGGSRIQAQDKGLGCGAIAVGFGGVWGAPSHPAPPAPLGKRLPGASPNLPGMRCWGHGMRGSLRAPAPSTQRAGTMVGRGVWGCPCSPLPPRHPFGRPAQAVTSPCLSASCPLLPASANAGPGSARCPCRVQRSLPFQEPGLPPPSSPSPTIP